MVVRRIRNVEVDREILTLGDLEERIRHLNSGTELRFLRAETSAKYRTPFVLVRYALNGVEQKEGLRLDLDKRTFLDHLEDSSLDALITQSLVAKRIADKVGDFLNRQDYSNHERP